MTLAEAEAEAVQAYARQAKNRQLELDAEELRVRAEIKLGEIQREQPKNKGAAGGGKKAAPRGSVIEPRDTAPTLAELGIDKKLSARAQESAEVEEREAIAAIGAQGERELASVKAWVASGCQGPQPRPDAKARRVLGDRLMAAIEAREVAKKASGRGTRRCRQGVREVGRGAAYPRAEDASEAGEDRGQRIGPGRARLVGCGILWPIIALSGYGDFRRYCIDSQPSVAVAHG